MPEFRSLASWLAPCAIEAPTAFKAPQPVVEAIGADRADLVDEEQTLREVRYFRAHLREALENALATLLADIASEIVARELCVAPADILRIVSAAVERYEFETPLRVRVHPEDAPALDSCELPVQPDGTLRRGDAVLELRGGAIDLTLGVRLERLLSTHGP